MKPSHRLAAPDFSTQTKHMKRTQGQYGADKNLIFDLKHRLDHEIYDFLWRKINLPRISSR